jgi:predicted RNA methylase
MTDWSSDLQIALASGDPAFMKAMLARVPKSVLHTAVPYLQELAVRSVRDRELDTALTYYDQLVDLQPDDPELRSSRAQVYLSLDRLADVLVEAEHIVRLDAASACGHRLQAQAYDGLRDRQRAAAAYKEVLRAEPEDQQARQRLEALQSALGKEQLLRQALQEPTAAEPNNTAPPPRPQVEFDPALLSAREIPDSLPKPMVDGLRRHLLRYSAHQSSRNTLNRLDDPLWLASWDRALESLRGRSVILCGSELGALAVRSQMLGAKRVLALESHPLDARIASGIVQKNLLLSWHAQHGTAIQSWSEEQREASFAAAAAGIRILPLESPDLDLAGWDAVIFPNIDHSLLGTGIARVIRQLRDRGLDSRAQILPARATLYAMGIEWTYPATEFQLAPLRQLRWSAAPGTLPANRDGWRALTQAHCIGSVDLEHFREVAWDMHLSVTAEGCLDALIYWFDLELGEARLSNAPDSDSRYLRPAVQYTDPQVLRSGEQLPIRIEVSDHSLRLNTRPPIHQPRTHSLPSWYVPMLLDRSRNEAYSEALQGALAANPASVLDIGAGCGLLSMMAAQAGATVVTGCEVNPTIAQVGQEIVASNRLADRITFIAKDCRALRVPNDLPVKAEVALFELFDCSLIGEGVLHFLAHAREHLLSSAARYIPLAASIHAMVIEYRLDELLGVDVNLLNPYRCSPTFINVDASRLAYRALTEPAQIFAFDFRTATPQPQQTQLSLPAVADGIAGAVLFWFDLQLNESLRISNHPQSHTKLHWQQGLQFLPEVRVQAATALPLTAKHDGSALSFGWQPDVLAKELFSALPRYDPRCWQQATELEQQTRELLHHCSQHPQEYVKVAELAARFAADPATYGIDPVIAQRFAATFFG